MNNFVECVYPTCIEDSITNKGYPRCTMHLDYVPEKKNAKPKSKPKRKEGVMSAENCLYPQCMSAQRSRGLCWTHARDPIARDKYALPSKTGGAGGYKKRKPIKKGREQCVYSGCLNVATSRGLCWGHNKNTEIREKYGRPGKRTGGSVSPRRKKKQVVEKEDLKDPSVQFAEDIEAMIDRRVEERVKKVMADALERINS